MSVRDFLRGGYKRIEEPTVITKHKRPVGMWLPPWTNFTVINPPPRPSVDADSTNP